MIARLPYGSAPEGTVLAQDPPAHAQGIEQPSVNLLLAAPDDETPDGYVMPDLTGWQFANAEAALKKGDARVASTKIVAKDPITLQGNARNGSRRSRNLSPLLIDEFLERGLFR